MMRVTYCSFCGEHRLNSRFFQEAAVDAAICGSCVTMCVRMMAEGKAFFRTTEGESESNDDLLQVIEGSIGDAKQVDG